MELAPSHKFMFNAGSIGARPRWPGMAFTMASLRSEPCLVPFEVAKAAQLSRRAALVVGVDELFRLALVGMLKSRFDYDTITEIGMDDTAPDRLPTVEPVDLIILEADAMLDCSDRLSRLHRQYPGTRVVVVSQSARPDDILGALRAGAHGFVPKGISVADMVHALTIVLGGTLWIPGSAGHETLATEAPASGPYSEKPVTDGQELTHRQREVLHHIVQGKSNKQIAKLMSLREGTIKVHVAGLLRNLGVSNRSRAAAIGSQWLLPT